MMNRRGFLAVGILLIPLFAQAEIPGHQQRMLEFAEHAIVQGKGAEPELGLDVIGESNGPQSLQFLTELVRWQRGMDAGQGESYTCYLLSKGNAILPYLEQMDPAALRQKCVAEFNGRKYGLKSSDNVDYICRSEKNIRLKKADIIAGLRDGIVCNDEDW